jgi:hypothetical protein
MKRFAVGLLAGCGLSGAAAAQAPQVPQGPQTVNVAPAAFSMPGTPVGKPIVNLVGNRLPAAVPAAGTRVGTGPGGIPSQLNPGGPTPPGQVIDMKNVVAPYPGQPKAAPSFWDKLQERWFSLFKSDQPAQRPPNWTPGLARRNRERAHERMAIRWRD